MNDNMENEYRINTPHFGELIVKSENIFTLEKGMLGFEHLKNYVIVSEEESAPFKWLISLEQPEIGFPLLNPLLLDLNYSPGNQYDKESLVFFVVITLEDEFGRMTANMKAPVILDTINLTGEQVILPFDKYSTNWVINENNNL